MYGVKAFVLTRGAPAFATLGPYTLSTITLGQVEKCNDIN